MSPEIPTPFPCPFPSCVYQVPRFRNEMLHFFWSKPGAPEMNLHFHCNPGTRILKYTPRVFFPSYFISATKKQHPWWLIYIVDILHGLKQIHQLMFSRKIVISIWDTPQNLRVLPGFSKQHPLF